MRTTETPMPLQILNKRREPTSSEILFAAGQAYNDVNSNPLYDGGHVLIVFFAANRSTQFVLVCETVDNPDEAALCLDQIAELIKDGARFVGFRVVPHAEGYNVARPNRSEEHT